MAVHGIKPHRLEEALERPYTVTRNRKDRRALLLFIGSDADGLCIAAPIGPTDRAGTYRPVTAWPCKRSEWAKLP